MQGRSAGGLTMGAVVNMVCHSVHSGLHITAYTGKVPVTADWCGLGGWPFWWRSSLCFSRSSCRSSHQSRWNQVEEKHMWMHTDVSAPKCFCTLCLLQTHKWSLPADYRHGGTLNTSEQLGFRYWLNRVVILCRGQTFSRQQFMVRSFWVVLRYLSPVVHINKTSCPVTWCS